ncbi:hypothetical protein [Streptomyces chartreusis]
MNRHRNHGQFTFAPGPLRIDDGRLVLVSEPKASLRNEVECAAACPRQAIRIEC